MKIISLLHGINVTTQRYHNVEANYIVGVQFDLDIGLNKVKSRTHEISALATYFKQHLEHFPHSEYFLEHFHKRFISKHITNLPNEDFVVRHTIRNLPRPNPGRVLWYAKSSAYAMFVYTSEENHPADIVNGLLEAHVPRDKTNIYNMTMWSNFNAFTKHTVREDRSIIIAGVTYGKIYGISTP